MKPVACGNQKYSTGSLRSPATMSAILFSKPSPLSFENGMLAASAQTRNAVWLTRSTRCPSAAYATSPSASAGNRARMRPLLVTEAGLFRLVRRRWLLDPLGRAPPRQRTVGARFQVDVDVIEVAHDVGIVAERRHLALLVGAHDFATAGNDLHKIGIAHGLERLDQTRRIGRALTIGAMADMALGMVAAETGERVPIDGTVARNIVGRRAVGGF